MKALSIEPLYAMLFARGERKYEIRTWQRSYRGDLLICSSSKRQPGCISGHALGVVELVDIHAVTKSNYEQFGVTAGQFKSYPHLYAFEFDYPQLVVPFPVKGKLGLYDVDDSLIDYLDIPTTDADDDALFFKYWKPLIRD